MGEPAPKHLTLLLRAWSDGDEGALEELTPLIYGELHRLARGYMHGEREGHILQTSALVNEAYLRLIDWKNVDWRNRNHFFGVAAKMMRRVLVDYARSRNYAKRGGGIPESSLDRLSLAAPEPNQDFVALDEALRRLEVLDPNKSKTVELRFFGGLTVEETAEVLSESPRTVMRNWSLARAWLYRELTGPAERSPSRI